jgi:uncharacterized protein YjlB
MPGIRVTRWSAEVRPTDSALRGLMQAEGLTPSLWSNGPFETYAAHSHDYDKAIYVVSGSITFGLPSAGDAVELKAGDRLDLPAGTVHDASVGEQGVTCLEGHAAHGAP